MGDNSTVPSSPAPPAARVALQLSCCEGSMMGRFDPGSQVSDLS